MDWMIASVRAQRLFIELRVFERARVHAGNHARNILQAAHALELDQLVIEIGKRKLVGLELLLQLGCLFLHRTQPPPFQ